MNSEIQEQTPHTDVDVIIESSKEEVKQIEIRTAVSNIPILEDYSIREDDEITSSDDDENEEHHDSSFRSWFSRSRHHKLSATESPVKLEPVLTNEPAIAEGTPQRQGSRRGGFRAFFKRDSAHEKEEQGNLQVGAQGDEGVELAKSAGDAQEESQLPGTPTMPTTPTSSKFWKHFRSHRHRHRHATEMVTSSGVSEIPAVETLRLPSTDDADMISHEEKRQKNMAKLADQLEAVSPGSSPERDAGELDAIMTPERKDLNENSSESASTSSSIERAQLLKERVGLVFSASPAESHEGKPDEVSPLTPPGDVVENPYNYVFEPAKQKFITPVAQDSTVIDNSSLALKNFDNALKLMAKDAKISSYIGGRSSVTIAEISNQLLDFIKHEVQCQEHLREENKALSGDLELSKSELANLLSEFKAKEANNLELQNQLDEVKENVKAHKADLINLEDECQKKIAEKQELQTSLKENSEILKSLKVELSELKEQCLKKDARKVELEKALDSSNEKIYQMDKDLEEAAGEIDMLSEEVESYKGKIQEAKTSERMAIERAEKDIAQAKKDTELEVKSKNELLTDIAVLKSKLEDLQKEHKNLVFDHEMLQEKHSITTTRLADLAGSFSKEQGTEREMRDNIEATGNKLRRYENTIEILKIGNLKIQENFHRERRKVLDLRQENNLYQKQLQFIECHRSQSLQFMSHLMFYYRNIVTDETLAQFDFYLKKLNESNFGLNIVRMKDDELKECFKEREAVVVKFYKEIAKQMFLDQVVAKHVSYMRSNNFLSSQLAGLRKQIHEYEQYVNRLLKEIKTQKNIQGKNKQKIDQITQKNAEYKSKISQIAN